MCVSANRVLITWCCFSVPGPHPEPYTAISPAGNTSHPVPPADNWWWPHEMVHSGYTEFSTGGKHG